MYDLLFNDTEFGWVVVDGYEYYSEAAEAQLEEMKLHGTQTDSYRILYVG